VYPPGLPVARVSRIERHAESAFSKIYCAPQALTSGARHVIVVKPITSDLGLRPEAAAPVAPARKGTAK
jgi:rod shape-determining protein MreC